jgi:MarR family transcriptional regulator, organic hydroperoxide resistance regulator
MNDTSLVDQCLDELEPLIARQRKAVAAQGCLRAISNTHLHVLFVLTTDGPLAMGQLADQLDCSMPSVSGIVDRMVGHGLVERLRDDDDRRLVVVRATKAGRAAVEEIDMVRRQQLARVLEMLEPAEQEAALRVFRSMRAAANQLSEQPWQTHRAPAQRRSC